MKDTDRAEVDRLTGGRMPGRDALALAESGAEGGWSVYAFGDAGGTGEDIP